MIDEKEIVLLITYDSTVLIIFSNLSNKRSFHIFLLRPTYMI